MRLLLHGCVLAALVSCLPVALFGQEEEAASPLAITQEGADREAAPSTSDAADPTLEVGSGPSQEPVATPALEVAGQVGDPAELWVLANGAYEEGDYERAVALYEQLIVGGADSGFAHYNLGNAYLRSGQLGRSIASYRRALALEPRDQDTQANLGFARRSARDAISPPEPAPLMRALFFWHYGLSRADMIRVGALFNLLFWGVLALLAMRRESEALRWLALVLAVFVIGSVGSLVAGAVAPTRVAVVVPQEIDVYSGTDRESVVRFKLHAGTEVKMAQERGAWLRIELPDGQQGWIERGHAEVVVGR